MRAEAIDPRRQTYGNRPSLAETHADLAGGLDDDNFTAWELTAGSHYKVQWRCAEHGHAWVATVSDRTKGYGCPVCAGRLVLAGFNDLLTLNPALAAEWDLEANDRGPDQVTVSSNRKVHWRCAARGHTWSATVNSRTRGNGCPVCSGRAVLAGFNDLLTLNPALAAEWDLEANDRGPDQVTVSSGHKAHWRCAKYGHAWMTTVRHRTDGHGCPVCAGKAVLAGFNDLQTLNPALAAEWDLAANERGPDQVTVSSHHKVQWKCTEHGHAWVASVNSRTKGNGCPVCAGKAVLAGFSDLQTLNPALAAEWDLEANERGPNQVTVSSGSKVHWRCAKYGHAWVAAIHDRTRGNGCPACSQSNTSHVEQALFRTLNQLLDDCVNGSRIPLLWSTRQKTATVDILGGHHGRNVAVEYDGSYYHRGKAKYRLDESKTLALLEAGYLVVRVRENGLEHLGVAHPSLLQLDYQYRGGTEEQIDTYLYPVAAMIVDWLDGAPV